MIRSCLAKIVWRFRRRPALLTRGALDVPSREELAPGELVVVGPRKAPKWASMQCPCGCGVPYLLSLSLARRPRWSVASDWLLRPTLNPSVRRLDGCRSHFWLREGEVLWCRDTGFPPQIDTG